MITRRRFLAISAAAVTTTPGHTAPLRWQGLAMGAQVSLTLDAPPEVARPALSEIRKLLEKCETLFSLYRPDSALSRLNRQGSLASPDPLFLELLTRCGTFHSLSQGRFDPTVQPLWVALSKSGNTDTARTAIGWHRVNISPHRVTLDKGQELTLNGVAQGYATDLITRTLRQAGLTRVLVNIGEFYASGRSWQIGISDPVLGLVATRQLEDRAIATSSPGAMTLPQNHSHILNPIGTGNPLWSTISVEAADATTADALSTAFCHAPSDEIRDVMRAVSGHPRAICVTAEGTIQHIPHTSP